MFLTVEKVMILRSVSIFAEVPEEVLADLAGYLEQLDVAAEAPVYEKGALGRTMYIVADGKVRVRDETHTFVELGPGELFGELTTLDPEPHSASVTAVPPRRVRSSHAKYETTAAASLRPARCRPALSTSFFLALKSSTGLASTSTRCAGAMPAAIASVVVARSSITRADASSHPARRAAVAALKLE